MSSLFLCFVFFILSIIISPLIIRGTAFFLERAGLMDRPHLYKSELGRKPAPYGVGIALIFILLLLSPFIFFFSNFSPLLEKRFLIVLIIGIGISIISFIDDMDTIGKSRIKVPPLARLCMQILV
jgi:UDP-N-acetylmuramyl pentapeptide phosphotransferase/UDP-N-acetylglucosamine-1-phosphate transferase